MKYVHRIQETEEYYPYIGLSQEREVTLFSCCLLGRDMGIQGHSNIFAQWSEIKHNQTEQLAFEGIRASRSQAGLLQKIENEQHFQQDFNSVQKPYFLRSNFWGTHSAILNRIKVFSSH